LTAARRFGKSVGMSLRLLGLAGLAVLGIVACGPSSSQVKHARFAHYDAERGTIFAEAIEAARSLKHRIEALDEAQGVFRTDPRWYTRDGSSARRDADDNYRVRGGDVLLALVVSVHGQERGGTIDVQPLAYQHVQGSPQPRMLSPDDPAMPGWVQGKVDSLYLAIYQRLQAHEIPMETEPAAP
jgi:hypothetical protein